METTGKSFSPSSLPCTSRQGIDSPSQRNSSRPNWNGCACTGYADPAEVLWIYTQPIHVHCFTGDIELVTEWMSHFSNVYFGFTGAVENFSSDQIAGLQSVPLNRILLETDSPYMRPGGGSINTPAFIGDVASLVASKLQISVQHLLKETVQNGRRLYSC